MSQCDPSSLPLNPKELTEPFYYAQNFKLTHYSKAQSLHNHKSDYKGRTNIAVLLVTKMPTFS